MGLDAEYGGVVSATRAFLNGQRADEAALIRFARRGFSHYTTMQVRHGAVRGLALHLARLEHATQHLFDAALDVQLLRARMRAALAECATPDAALRITIGANNFTARTMEYPAKIDVLALVDPPASGPEKPTRLGSFEHERYLPQIKHSGTFDLFDLRRRALADGFDDALLVTSSGHLAEGTTFNIGFFSGEKVLWPLAPRLDGTTMQLLKQGVEALGRGNIVSSITLEDIRMLDGGFCCHSGGIWPIRAIDEMQLPLNEHRLTQLREIWDAISPEPL